jgi:hypothetical protein
MSSKISNTNNLNKIDGHLYLDDKKNTLLNQIYIYQIIIILFIIVILYHLYVNKKEQKNEEKLLLKILRKL